MFRYELHSMLNKHLFESEDESKEQIFLLGKRPLSIKKKKRILFGVNATKFMRHLEVW
jgi:hypothetical protein